MIKTIIIEDVGNTREAINAILERNCPDIKVVGEAADVTSGIGLIHEAKPDLVLLDIQLKDGTAFDLLGGLATINFSIIFITAFESYAIRAFKFSALDYIVKPIRSADLVNAIHKFTEIRHQEDLAIKIATYLSNLDHPPAGKKIVLKSVERIMVLDIKEIVRCESQANYTMFHLADGQQLLESKTLKEFEDLLEDFNFLRVHHSHMINLAHFRSFEKLGGGYIVMNDESTVPVSKRKKDKLLRILESL